MSAPLAVVPCSQDGERPDIAWIKKNVSVLEVGKVLGLRIRHRRAKCWRPENHAHDDAEPSLHFFERRNRVRCFVCDMRGGHSCIDLVMGTLGIDFVQAVRWIAERFPVPNVKVGRPVGNAFASPMPYRVGVHGSEWEVIVRSGMWAAMSSAERSILMVLDYFKDPDSGLTHVSYRAIMRYSGVARKGNVSAAIKELSKMHVLRVSRGQRIGITRECSAYRITLDDPKFRELCNTVFADARHEIDQEREYRACQKRERERVARKPKTASLQVITQTSNTAGGLRPPDPPHIPPLNSNQGEKETPTCEGLNLCSPGEPHANKSVPIRNREISFSSLGLSIEEQKQILRERGFLQ